MIHHYITKYEEQGISYAESWIQLNLFNMCWCFSKKRIHLEAKPKIEKDNQSNEILTNSTDSIVITKKNPGNLVDVETGNQVIASISNDEIILHDDYDVKIMLADRSIY